MRYSNVINLIQHQIENRKETVAETITLIRQDLLTSDDNANILIPVHNVLTTSQMYLFILSTYCFHTLFPDAKIFIVTPVNTLQYHVLSRFRHFSCIFQINRYIQIIKLMDMLEITKILYALDAGWQLQLINQNSDLKPKLIYKQSDLVYAAEISKQHKKLLLLSHCNHNDLLQYLDKNIKYRHIILGNTLIPNMASTQLTHDGLYMNDVKCNNLQQIISTAIGLMQQHSFLKIDKELNIFDVLRLMM